MQPDNQAGGREKDWVMINAGRIFIYIEIGVFAVFGLLLPLGTAVLFFPGEFAHKIVSIMGLGLPYALTEFAPYFTWFWLSAIAIVVLLWLLNKWEDEMTSGAMIMSGIGVIIAFFVADVILAYSLLALQMLGPESDVGRLVEAARQFAFGDQ